MNFAQSISSVFSKYIVFSGRACRSEYWWFFLFEFIVGLVLSIIFSPLYWVFLLGTIIPSLAVLVRRLHDTDKSAWTLLFGLIPFFGGIILLILAIPKGDSGTNRYGPDPLGSTADVGYEQGPVDPGLPEGTRHCANCGAPMDPAANFCRSCGTAI